MTAFIATTIFGKLPGFMITLILTNKAVPLSLSKFSNLKYFGFILLLAFVAQTFSKTFITAGYYANTAAYAKNCENKAKPTMHCNGKCQLMKKLKQEENKDKQNPDRKTDNKEEILSSKSFFADVQERLLPAQKIYPPLGDSKATAIPRSIFHPPGRLA